MHRFPATIRHVATLAASASVHVALAAVAGGHGATGELQQSSPRTELIVELEAAPPTVDGAEERAPRERVPPPRHTHKHSYPVPADHDSRAHDPSLRHLPVPASPVAQATTERPTEERHAEPDTHAEPVRFVLSAGSALRTHGTLATSGVQPASGSQSGDVGEILKANEVDVPATLRTSAAVVYPAEARDASIEADVPVEIVVEATGSVSAARALSKHGLGLEEAAVRAVRAYSFSPARRQGRAVRVRMRWTVRFQLR